MSGYLKAIGGSGGKKSCEVIRKDLIEMNMMLKRHEKILFLARVMIF